MPKINDEFQFIRKITPTYHKQSKLILGINDDAALFESDVHVDQVVCMDTMVEGVHFIRKTMKPFHIGYKVLASNISDIAAMGGKPLFYLISIAIPPTWQEDELLQIYDGMNQLAEKYSIDLIGGDTVSTSEKLVITVTIIGGVPKGKRLLRSNAQAGDIVFVTGTIGDSGAGLEILLQSEKKDKLNYNSNEQFLMKKHQLPTPRVDIAKLLINVSRVSLNDISDGLASELYEIAEASGVMIEIDADKLPISEALRDYAKTRALDFALYGGEDFELVGTISEIEWPYLLEKCKNTNLEITNIGKVYNGTNVYLSNKELLEKKGYNHFK